LHKLCNLVALYRFPGNFLEAKRVTFFPVTREFPRIPLFFTRELFPVITREGPRG